MKKIFLLLLVILLSFGAAYADTDQLDINGNAVDRHLIVNRYWDMLAKQIVAPSWGDDPIVVPLIAPGNESQLINAYGGYFAKYPTGTAEEFNSRWVPRSEFAQKYALGQPVPAASYQYARAINSRDGSGSFNEDRLLIYGLPYDYLKPYEAGAGWVGGKSYWKMPGGYDNYISAPLTHDQWMYTEGMDPDIKNSDQTYKQDLITPRYRGFTNIGAMFNNSDTVDDAKTTTTNWSTRDFALVDDYDNYGSFGPDFRSKAYWLAYDLSGPLTRADATAPGSIADPDRARAVSHLVDQLDQVNDKYFNGQKSIGYLFDHLNPLSIAKDGFMGAWFGWFKNASGGWSYVTFTIPGDPIDDDFNLIALSLTSDKKHVDDLSNPIHLKAEILVVGSAPAEPVTVLLHNKTDGSIVAQTTMVLHDGINDFESDVYMTTRGINEFVIDVNPEGFRAGIPLETTYIDNVANIFLGNVQFNLYAKSLVGLDSSGSPGQTFIFEALVGNAGTSVETVESVRVVLKDADNGKIYAETWVDKLAPGNQAYAVFATSKLTEIRTYNLVAEINPAPDRDTIFATETTYADNISNRCSHVIIDPNGDCFTKNLTNTTSRSYTIGLVKTLWVEKQTRSKIYEDVDVLSGWITEEYDIDPITGKRIKVPCKPYRKVLYTKKVWTGEYTRWRTTWVPKTHENVDRTYTETFAITDVLIKSRQNNGNWQSLKSSPGYVKAGYGFEMNVVTKYNSGFSLPRNESTTYPASNGTLSRYTGDAEYRYTGSVDVVQNSCLKVTMPDGMQYMCYKNDVPGEFEANRNGSRLAYTRTYQFIPRDSLDIGKSERKYYLSDEVANGTYNIKVMADFNGVINDYANDEGKPKLSNLRGFSIKVIGSMWDDLPIHELE